MELDLATDRRPSTTPVFSGKVWLDATLALFYPDVCQICGEEEARRADGYVGARCLQAVQWIEKPFCEQCGLPFEGEISGEFVCEPCRKTRWYFASARAAVVAKGVAMEMIHRFKYQRALWFETALAQLLVRQATPWFQERLIDCIIPVPLHPVKEREREFNQAELLARQLSRAVRVPHHSQWLQRVKFTETQTLLTRSRRQDNMRDAFAVAPGTHQLKGLHVALVDDVFTTGSTVNSCARALRKAGASSVSVWTVGRAIL